MLNTINIKELERTAAINITRYASPEMNIRLHFACSLLNINPYNIKDQIWDIRKEELVLRTILTIATKNQEIDYTKVWYKWIKNKINEFNYRYLRKKLIVKDSKDKYKKIFKLFLYISTRTNILSMKEPGKELDYFIAAQYSTRYNKDKGLLATVSLNTFLYTTAYNGYRRFKDSYLNPCLAGTELGLQYYTYRHKITLLKDHQFVPFVDYGAKIIGGTRLPVLKNKEDTWLQQYMQTLELLIIREKQNYRTHFKFLFSIEHLRAHTELAKRGVYGHSK